ncbi:MAG: dimethylarginine dimethylaminohydrolase family protein [Gammaproteobacteria bacterium]
MRFTQAILRTPGPDCAKGLTTADLGTPDYGRLLEQHAAYREALEGLGVRCTVLEPLAGSSDAYFVEDAAIVTPELAVITRPGAPSRQGETATIEKALAGLKPITHITAPGTVDGGDIMFADNHSYIGLSERTNKAGADQLTDHLQQAGIDSTQINVPSGLHLKSSVNYIERDRLLLTRDFADQPAFSGFEQILLDREENYAANTLWINGTLLMPTGYPEIQGKLRSLDYPIITLDMSEAAKMDGGLSCLSLRF